MGGAEKHLLWLGGGQVQRGHDVSVLYLKGEGELRADFEAAGMSVHSAPLGSLLAAPLAVGKLTRAIRERAPDVLHTHLLKADALGALAGARAGVPARVSSKHNDERALLKRSVGLVHGRLMRRVHRLIALSEHVRHFVAEHGGVPLERLQRIYYGVDPDGLQASRSRAEVRAELGLDPDTPVLVCVGRLAPQKDHPTLLAALAQLPPEVTLLIVGDDPFGGGRARLEAEAHRLGLGERARFLGIRHDVPDLLVASDLFVLPSLWEGLGLVFLEAMAVGLPVVATQVSAIPEVVEHGRTGWLVPPSDPGALAATLAEALSAPAERAARGEASRALLAERFGLPRMIEETLALYTEILEAGR
ncbi:MAG: glycosyl transferase [Planctomycetota bacterium]|nr:MAG: glycosyl transferase [Planctomycetota bacterium]